MGKNDYLQEFDDYDILMKTVFQYNKNNTLHTLLYDFPQTF